MEVAKVVVTDEWQKLDELVAQAKPGFAFDSGKTYQLQAEGEYGVRLCVSADTPGEKDGVRIVGTQTAHFKVESGKDLYVKSVGGLSSAAPLLDVSTIGE